MQQTLFQIDRSTVSDQLIEFGWLKQSLEAFDLKYECMISNAKTYKGFLDEMQLVQDQNITQLQKSIKLVSQKLVLEKKAREQIRKECLVSRKQANVLTTKRDELRGDLQKAQTGIQVQTRRMLEVSRSQISLITETSQQARTKFKSQPRKKQTFADLILLESN